MKNAKRTEDAALSRVKFTIGGKRYAARDQSGCDGCAFLDDEVCLTDKRVPQCSRYLRRDGRSVIFVIAPASGRDRRFPR